MTGPETDTALIRVTGEVTDPTAPGRHYIAQSVLARQTLRCVLDVPYGPTLAETLDIFPAAVPNAPVFVFLHGGYWRALSSKEFSCVALGLQPLGITKYRLAKEIGVPAQRIGEIVAGRRAITADTDLRLCRFFGLSSGYWLRAQAAHDTKVAQRALAGELRKIRPWKAA